LPEGDVVDDLGTCAADPGFKNFLERVRKVFVMSDSVLLAPEVVERRVNSGGRVGLDDGLEGLDGESGGDDDSGDIGAEPGEFAGESLKKMGADK
jgi:hypothetical protein